MNWNFIINRLGEEESGPVSPPIYQTSNFRFGGFRNLKKALEDEQHALVYSRGNNPTLDLLSMKLAALAGADNALLCSSGMAAISTAVISVLQQGDHVVCMQNPYSWTKTLISELLARFGVTVTYVAAEEIIEAISDTTRLVYLESPASYTFEVADLKKIANYCKEKGVTTIIDNSYSSPLLQQPLKFGIDIEVHSATKYIGGHSDTLGGVLLCNNIWYSKIFSGAYLTLGGVMSPTNAWLMLRGLRTLPVRMSRISQSAGEVIGFLEQHPRVSEVRYPGSKNAHQKEIACQQMASNSGLFSLELKDAGIKQIELFCDALQLFQIAVSWGGHESLVLPAAALPNSSLPMNFIRLSIGLEDSDALIQDIEQAMNKAFA